MTLLFVDGFDVGDFLQKWQCEGTVSLFSSTVRPFPSYPGRSLHIEGNNFGADVKHGITPSAEVIAGVNFRWDDTAVHGAFGSGETGIFQFSTDGGTRTQLALALTPSGSLRLYRGDMASGAQTLLATGPAAQIRPGVFYEIEAKVTIGASGIGVVHVNEVEAINFVGNTLDSGSATAIDMVTLHKIPFGSACPDTYFDEFYVCNGLDDGIGPANNDFLGIGRVQTILPNGPGASTALVPTGSASNWDNVNDVPFSTADYNSSATVGARDTYTLDNLTGTIASIAGVQTVVMAQADDAGARIKAALRSGGSVYYDPAVALDGTASDVSVVVREQDPATSATWTVTGVNALEAGVEISS